MRRPPLRPALAFAALIALAAYIEAEAAGRLKTGERKLNGFRADVLPAFLTAREPLESARKAMASRRSPCNPEHVHNLLRILSDIP